MLSIVIPCYNEENCIKENLNTLKNYLNINKIDNEIICINDGSKDRTTEILQQINGINVISYDDNKGKGFAVKQGITAAKGEKILFMDADLSTDLSAIKECLKYDEDIVIGSRMLKNSTVTNKPFIRKLSSFISNKIIYIVTGIKIKDTQCGFKLFKTEIGKQITEKQHIERWAFDVEYLYIAKLNNFSIKEIPVLWENDCDSKVHLIKDSISFFNEVIKIRKNRKKYV